MTTINRFPADNTAPLSRVRWPWRYVVLCPDGIEWDCAQGLQRARRVAASFGEPVTESWQCESDGSAGR